MSDLLSAGSAQVTVAADPAAAGGVTLRGSAARALPQRGAIGELLRTARQRLRQGRPPPPSSALQLELRQEHKGRSAAADRRRSSSEETSGGGGGGGDADLVSSLLLADVETNALGDGLASGLRQLLSGPGSAHAAHSGPALLLRDAVGGNCKTVLLGTVAPEDFAESCATLQLVAQGAGFVNFPLVNDVRARGLLAPWAQRPILSLGDGLSSRSAGVSRRTTGG